MELPEPDLPDASDSGALLPEPVLPELQPPIRTAGNSATRLSHDAAARLVFSLLPDRRCDRDLGP
eukprot:4975383-Pyramimonas_sp.AAC.1